MGMKYASYLFDYKSPVGSSKQPIGIYFAIQREYDPKKAFDRQYRALTVEMGLFKELGLGRYVCTYIAAGLTMPEEWRHVGIKIYVQSTLLE